jgi:hypothetical protein
MSAAWIKNAVTESASSGHSHGMRAAVGSAAGEDCACVATVRPGRLHRATTVRARTTLTIAVAQNNRSRARLSTPVYPMADGIAISRIHTAEKALTTLSCVRARQTTNAVNANVET